MKKDYKKSSEKVGDFLIGFFGVFLLYVLASELIPRYSPAIIFILFALLTFYFWDRKCYISFGIVAQLIVSVIISVLVYFSLSFHSVTS